MQSPLLCSAGTTESPCTRLAHAVPFLPGQGAEGGRQPAVPLRREPRRARAHAARAQVLRPAARPRAALPPQQARCSLPVTSCPVRRAVCKVSNSRTYLTTTSGGSGAAAWRRMPPRWPRTSTTCSGARRGTARPSTRTGRCASTSSDEGTSRCE